MVAAVADSRRHMHRFRGRVSERLNGGQESTTAPRPNLSATQTRSWNRVDEKDVNLCHELDGQLAIIDCLA